MFAKRSSFMGCGRQQRTTILFVFTAAFAAALCNEVAAEKERESVGYVFDSTGDWMQDGIKLPHKSGDPVYAGAVITLDAAYKEAQTRGAAITIILFNGKREERSLEQPANFAKPIELPKSLGEQSSHIGRLLRAMGGLFSGHSEKYLITTVRGADLLQLHEAVVKLDDGEIDLAPVFKTAPAGKYLVRLRLVQIEAPSERNALPESLAFDWKPEREQRLAVPGLRPGLWRVSLLQPEDERPLGVDAWALICTPNKYEKVAGSFNQVVALTNKWGEKVSNGEVRSLLRTALDALAQQREK
jgi:hypothetical protein